MSISESGGENAQEDFQQVIIDLNVKHRGIFTSETIRIISTFQLRFSQDIRSSANYIDVRNSHRHWTLSYLVFLWLNLYVPYGFHLQYDKEAIYGG